MIAATGMLAAELSYGQGPTVQGRAVAASGPDSKVTEPAIAAGPDNVVAVFYELSTSRTSWYATRNNWTGKWTEGEIDPNTAFDGFTDLSVAHDGVTGGYLAVAQAYEGDPRIYDLAVCRFVPDPAVPGRVVPLSWEEAPSLGIPDKPWIVAGKADPEEGQEFYIVYYKGNSYGYLHSLDGGTSWTGGAVKVGTQEVVGAWCAQPAVYRDGPLYVAYIHSGAIYFLVGEDQPSGQVWFTRLVAENSTPPVPLSVPLKKGYIRTDVPGDFPHPALSTVPYLAVDPNNADRLFIAYHDVVSSDPNHAGYSDVNVYVHEIVRDGAIWELGNRIKVNNDHTQNESDQFMPELIVDAAGYVHVLFYDDRRFTDSDDPNDPNDQQPDVGTPRPKFDAYYAWAPVTDLDFDDPEHNLLLYLRNPSDPDEPAAFDRTLAPHGTPREYNGIAWYADRIWTAYTGMSEDEEDNKTVIWSSRIDW